MSGAHEGTGPGRPAGAGARVARVVGLTGGIASGKSLVARLFREAGVPVVDADVLARRVVEPGQPAYDDIVRAFGPEVVLAEGGLDRKRLGEIVFSDPAKRRLLGSLTHPRIAALAQAEAAAHAARGAPLVLYEAALLVENGLHRMLEGLIVVAVPEEVQLQRLMARDGLGEAEAKQRIGAQLPLADKLAVATHVIDNAGPEESTRAQVAALLATVSAPPEVA